MQVRESRSPIARPLVPHPARIPAAARPAVERGGATTAAPAPEAPGLLRRAVAWLKALFAGGTKDVGPAQVAAGADLHEQRRTWFMSQHRGAYNPAENAPTNLNCGPASLAMIAKAFGKTAPDRRGVDAAIEDARARMGEGVDEREATSVAGLVTGARSYGLAAATKRVSALADVQAELAAGKLVIASVVPTYADARATNGHFAVVTKIEGGQVWLNDPGKASGPFTVSAQAFWEALSARSRTIVPVGRGSVA